MTMLASIAPRRLHRSVCLTTSNPLFLYKGGIGALLVNGKKVGEGHVAKTMGRLYS